MAVTEADLDWYYSVGNTNNNANADATKSLGGARSTAKVPDANDNVFPEVSGDQARTGIPQQYRALFFRNSNTSDTYDNPQIYMPTALGNADVELKYVVDANGVGDSMEQITTDVTTPQNGSGTNLTFADFPTGVPNDESTGKLADALTNQSIGVWFYRKIEGSATAASVSASIVVTGAANV